MNTFNFLTYRRLFICFIFFTISSHWSIAQTLNDSIPDFQEGVVYLHLKESSGITLSIPTPTNLDSIESLIYQVFDEFDVSNIERPFMGLPSSIFNHIYRITFGQYSVDDFIIELNEISAVELVEKVPLYQILYVPDVILP